ncbi:MAG: hypothetical protein JWM25_1783, partial [Thermoleophilia bacterium]|nr:hypothetical protein [Thermoleophilia bacterium]
YLEDIDSWDATTAWATGTTGVLFATTNGTAWNAQASGVGTQLNSIEPLSASTVVIVGAGGVILRTTDGGATWPAMTSGTVTGLVDVVAHGTSDLWAVGYAGTIRRSINGGVAWTGQASGVAQHLYGVAAGDANNLWAVGQAGRILHTTDAGATWTPQTSGVAVDLLDVWAQDSRTAWASGASGTLLRTVDAGATWSVVASGTTRNLNALTSTSAGTLLYAANSGEIGVSALHAVTDYNPTTANWTGAGTNAFGACLAGVAGGAAAGGGTWTTDVHGVAGDCLQDDLEPWSPVTTTSEVIATAAVPGPTTFEAKVRFGFRSGTAQAAGSYSAPILFDVVAP